MRESKITSENQNAAKKASDTYGYYNIDFAFTICDQNGSN